jgi:hypothetical protein
MTRSSPIACFGAALGLVLMTVPLQAAGPYDGVYSGTQKMTVTNNSGKCQNLDRDRVSVAIQDNVIRYPWAVQMEATIKPDGSFDASKTGGSQAGFSASYRIKGQITGGRLEADVGSNICGVHLSLIKG